MKISKIEHRPSVSAILTECDVFLAKEGDFVEVTEWTNGEGVDIYINTSLGQQHFSVTWDEFKVIKKLVKKLNNKHLDE